MMALVAGWKRRVVGARVGAALCAATVGILSGCQSVQGTSPHTMVRVIDASSTAKAVDVSLANTLIAYNAAAPSISNYAFVPPENATAYIYATGTKNTEASVAGTFEVSQQHSVLLTDSGTGVAATILTDQATAPPTGDVSMRFLQEAPTTGAVDVYLVPTGSTLADAKPLLTAVAVGSVTDYLNVAAGSYTLVITPTGNTKTTAGTALTLTAGQVRTMLVVDSQLTTNPPVSVVVGNDLN